MDKVYIGTAANIAAEVGSSTGVQADKFVIAHFYNDEEMTVEGFNTKEAALLALESYHGAEVEYLWIEL